MLQCIHKLRAGLVSVLRILLCALQDNLFQAGRKSWIPGAYGIHLIGRFTGIMPCEKMVKCRSQTINVSSGICLPMASILFRRCVSLGTQACGICHTALLEFPGRSKVYQHYLPVRLQHYIGRFHISVNNRRFSGMQIS